jgi:hypothetical protein
LAPRPSGQERILRALRLVLPNPYPRYRDIALVTLGLSCVAVPDRLWVRWRLQTILRTALDHEGVTFTFDLPSVLLADAQRRDIAAPGLASYLKEALECEDRWGTAMRAKSAQAAALSWQGEADQAFEVLKAASRVPTGYAGYGTITLLSLANRCWELGRSTTAAQPVWGWDGDIALLDRAKNLAHAVRDPTFREERISLVKAYFTWLDKPTPDIVAVRTMLAETLDPYVRSLYTDHVSARWAQGNKPNVAGLKALIPLVLADSTTLDAVLGRLFGLRVRYLDDDELAEAIHACQEKLTTGRPWKLGQYR